MATATANGVKPKSKTDQIVDAILSGDERTNAEYARDFDVDEGIARKARIKAAAMSAKPAPTMAVTEVTIYDLTLDLGTQLRPGLDETKVIEYAEGVTEGWREPIRVIRLADGRMVVTDGFHRIAAHQEADLDAVPAHVRDGTMDDAILEAAAANASHGLPRDAQTKRNAVLALLNHADWGNRSVQWLAETARVSRTLADKVRREWEAGRAPKGDDTRVGKDGKARPAKQFTPPAEPVHDREPGEDDDLGDENASVPVNVSKNTLTPADAIDPHREAALALPLTAKLSGDRREGFVQDATLYFALGDRRKAMGDLFRSSKPHVKPGGIIGRYAIEVERFLTTPHPRDWKECKASADHKRSCACGSRGYLVD
jgi:hypothetical protein